MTTFHPRAYGRTELAQTYLPTYTPEAAWRKLKEWINYHATLPETLQQLGYRPTQRLFTPRQVAAIVEALGEP